MTINEPAIVFDDNEIDLWEVFAVLKRRWRSLVAGCFLGLTIAGGMVSIKSPKPRVKASLIVDVAQGPCYVRLRKFNALRELSVAGMACTGEAETLHVMLGQIAEKYGLDLDEKGIRLAPDAIIYTVDRYVLPGKRNSQSATQLALNINSSAAQSSEISAVLPKIKRHLTDRVATQARNNGFEPAFGPQWALIEEPTELVTQPSSLIALLTLGLVMALVVGASSALIADRRSDRVYSSAKILRILGQPLSLRLPAGSWSSSTVHVLVGQLATQLDQALTWRVLSIAHQHEAVEPLSQLLKQQGGADFHCDSAKPLFSSVFRSSPNDKPIGLLLVVESGFNSARALEEARLAISQMSNVQDVGVFLIGAKLPDELRLSETK